MRHRSINGAETEKGLGCMHWHKASLACLKLYVFALSVCPIDEWEGLGDVIRTIAQLARLHSKVCFRKDV